MTQDPKIITPISVARPATYRGPLISEDYNKTQEELVADIQNLANVSNSLGAKLSRAVFTLQNDNAYLRKLVDSLKNQQEYLEKIAAYSSSLATRFVDLSDTSGISFPNGLNDRYSSMLNSEFGELTLPSNSTENKFYFTSLTTNRIVVPNTLSITVKGEFDKRDGNGIINYERGGTVYPGNPEYAFNGLNDTFWIRKVEFPLDSRVDEVECEMTVTIPDTASPESNTLEIIPFPNGSVDITELAYATDLGNNFTRIQGFSPVNNITSRRYHFTAVRTEQLKIRLRQRNWVEENGKKVFYYGLQELGLKLIDYDRTYTPGSSFGSNNSFILQIDAPDGFIFNKLYRIDPAPNFTLEDMSNRHVHMKLGISSNISNGTLWDSDSEYTPQQTNIPITLGSSSIYIFTELNYVNSVGGPLSPFLQGTTPYLKGIGLSYTLLAE